MRSKLVTDGRLREESNARGPANSEAVLRLVRSWMEDKSGYDEEAWPALKAAIEEDRLSARKRFCD